MGGGAAGLSLDSLDLGRQCGGDRHLDGVSSQSRTQQSFHLISNSFFSDTLFYSFGIQVIYYLS